MLETLAEMLPFLLITELAGVVLLLLALLAKRKRGETSLWFVLPRDLGAAVVVAGIIIVGLDLRVKNDLSVQAKDSISKFNENAQKSMQTSEASLRDFNEQAKKSIQNVLENGFKGALLEKTGLDVANELEKQIFDSPFQYHDYQINGILNYREDNGDKRVDCNLGSEYYVKNTATRDAEFTVECTATAIRPRRGVIWTSFAVKDVATGQGVVPHTDDGKQLECTMDAEMMATVASQLSDSSCVFRVHVPIKAQAEIKVAFSQMVTLDAADSLYFRARYPTKRMVLTLSFVENDLDLDLGYIYPLDRLPQDMRKPKPVGNAAIVEIPYVALPQQGVYAEWNIHTAETKGKLPIPKDPKTEEK